MLRGPARAPGGDRGARCPAPCLDMRWLVVGGRRGDVFIRLNLKCNCRSSVFGVEGPSQSLKWLRTMAVSLHVSGSECFAVRLFEP